MVSVLSSKCIFNNTYWVTIFPVIMAVVPITIENRRVKRAGDRSTREPADHPFRCANFLYWLNHTGKKIQWKMDNELQYKVKQNSLETCVRLV